MLKRIRYIEKQIKLTKDKDEIKILVIELYGLLLGYFSRKKDRTLINFNNSDILPELEYGLQNYFTQIIK